jgi:hypothetical protein
MLIDIAIIYYITEFKHPEIQYFGILKLRTLENIRHT